MLQFLIENRRWLGAGFLLTFASAFGQTWFISLFAGEIKAAHGLTDGAWGSLYTVATLGSAVLLLTRGSMVDTVPLTRLAPAVAVVFALAGLGLAFSPSVWLLCIALFLLRFCGQGMFSHMAMTAMGRWFQARRGQAVAISGLGHPAGEVVLPLITVLAMGAIGWKATWMVAALVLVVVVMPLLTFLLAEGRRAQGVARSEEFPGLGGRHWTRRDACRHWLFPALLPIMLTPGFIGTVVFFHQVHIAGVKGWTLAQMAPGYTVFATVTVASGLAAGWAADRFGPQRLLPVLLLPTGLGVALIGPAGDVPFWFAALGFVGLTQGMTQALWGTLLPAVYGTCNLGSIRALVTTVMVISTAIGPGLTGVLIDWGIDFPRQSLALGAWCLALSVAALLIERRLTRERRADPEAGSSLSGGVGAPGE